jgi:hypothetical protein
MRTSGSGRELWMTTIPLSVVLLYLAIVAGGPKELLKAMEKQLRSTVEWTVKLMQ